MKYGKKQKTIFYAELLYKWGVISKNQKDQLLKKIQNE
ncbi:BH2254 [Halalkalibacterium halodurans C-125]|jgi:hypothetical protein|uniref:BH2254 protein n=1 Tax=Halalkalibacterium halodurans (strain ATCC BAA-125 / DSM 18197 / FERM 7344 / JCM 9153 / C-125) TaxID=272558 RepID=Q9KAN3_HALH5|nr:BH2254 [Halalkalibacterium halodurans C-125]